MATGAGSIKKLKAFYKRNFGDPFDPDAISQEMENESDRASVILIGSVLEDELLNLICGTYSLRDDLNSNERNAIFGPDGPLGSFSKLINIAYAFSLITKSTRDQLTIIREMRNACAHHMGAISFSTPELAAVCKNLFHEDNDPLLPVYEGGDPEQLRFAFMAESLCLAMVIRLGDRNRAREEWMNSHFAP